MFVVNFHTKLTSFDFEITSSSTITNGVFISMNWSDDMLGTETLTDLLNFFFFGFFQKQNVNDNLLGVEMQRMILMIESRFGKANH